MSAYVNSTKKAGLDVFFQVTNVPPLGYAMYTVKSSANKKLGIISMKIFDCEYYNY